MIFFQNMSSFFIIQKPIFGSYKLTHKKKKRNLRFFYTFCNAGDRNRTGTMLPPQDFKSCASASSATPAYLHITGNNPGEFVAMQSGTNRARTCDPLLVRQMLSQLSYDPLG